MQLFWDGEDIDEEMGLPHVTCATFHMMAIATFMSEHPEFDDRFKRPQPNVSVASKDAAVKNMYDNALAEMNRVALKPHL